VLRPRDRHDRVEVRVALGAGAKTSVFRVVDLPDGTCLAYEPHSHAWARLRLDAIAPGPGERGGDRIDAHVTTEASTEIHVVGRSLAEILARALACDGRVEWTSLGTLRQALPGWVTKRV
jgi:hypothetical protein